MRDLRDLAEEIVAREGGFVNDPNDPGGATIKKRNAQGRSVARAILVPKSSKLNPRR